MSDNPPPKSPGWFKAYRGEDPTTLIKASPLAYTLAAVIAHRARWRDGVYSPHDLALGEAFIGDYRNQGMTERQYRTAKKVLEKGGFATFKATSKGTIAKLTDSRLFGVIESTADEQKDRQETDKPTGKRQAGDGQATTNLEHKSFKSIRAHAPNARACVPAQLGDSISDDETKAPPTLEEVIRFGRQRNISERICREVYRRLEETGWYFEKFIGARDNRPRLRLKHWTKALGHESRRAS